MGEKQAKRFCPSPITHHPSLNVLDVEDLVLFDAARGFYLGSVAGVLADKGARGRRTDRDLALLDVALVVAHDLVGDLLAASGVLELDGRAKHAAAVGIEPRRIDDLAVAELRLQLGNTPLDEALALLRCVILGVLREIAVRARLRDGGDDRRPLNRLQLVQLAAELFRASNGDWNLCHTVPLPDQAASSSLACKPCITYARNSVMCSMPLQATRAPSIVVMSVTRS